MKLHATHWPFLAVIGIGLVIGIAASGAFVVGMHVTSSDAFCSSCHAQNAVPEWKKSVHYANPVGVAAGCSDCHEPRDPAGLLLRKLAAVHEIWSELRGTIATPEAFEANRLRMAQAEWERLRANNSRECRNCHAMENMRDPARSFIAPTHANAIVNGRTCIDCHKGVAHTAPKATASP
jgi:nitrate/TMAO reductase-like tetraheme cytochrome c subunit